MSTQSTDYLSTIKNLDEDFQSYMVMGFVFLILIFMIGYVIYLVKLEDSECNYMNNLYSTLNGNIHSIKQDMSGSLYDYYVKTAYNACSGGSYKNDFVDICNLKAVLKQGVRCLDFEIYSIGNTPVVATSTQDNFYIKETFNSVAFGTVMKTINDYAFASGTAPNYEDPIIIHLRIKSNNQEMYSKLASIFRSYPLLMLGSDYSFEDHGHNIASKKLSTFKGKVILAVDRTNNAFLENKEILEFINITSNSAFMRAYNYNDVKNNPDINELTNFNRRGLTIALPDNGIDPANPSGFLCRELGCQMVAMRYQYNDNFLKENNKFFDSCGSAFCLKPERLRYTVVTIPNPTKQNPAYSYATREASSDYYSFKF